MKPLQWQQVRELFASTRQLPKEEHDEHLATSCNDPIVIEQVQKLLKHDREDDFLDSPALGDTFTLADTEEPVSGMQVPENLIDGYKLTGILGSGASGIVYEADQFNPKRTVAIKVLRAGAMGREEQLRFHREAETLASLNHPNIATIFAVGTTEDGSPWMAMELAKGERLDAWAEQATVQELTELFTTICDAIEVPHNNAIIHRDLKPANIVVTEHNNPKVLDFGVARVLQEQEAMTQTGAVIGTRSYMSPEQASGSFQVDARSDVFALGLMLDEFLPVNAPRDLRTIAMKAHDEFADRRYNSAGALHQDLVRFQQGKPVHARRAGVFYLANLWVKRHKAITSLFVLLMIASVFTYLQMHKVTKGEREKKQLSYSASIQEAQLYRDKGDLTSMKSALLETPEELRGWEWDWLHEQLSIGTLSTSAVAASAFSQTNILTVNPDHEVLHLIEGHSILPRDVTCKQSLISRDCSTILRLHDDHSISLTTAGELQPTHVIQLNTQWQNVAAIQLSDDGHFALLAVSVSFNPDDLSTLNAPSRLILIDCVEAKVVLNEQLNERVLDSNEAIAINGNATVIAAATVRGNVTVWKRDSTTIIDRRQFKVGQGSSLVALDTTGRLLAIAFLGTATSNVRLLTMDTLKTDENLPIIAHDHAITSIDISPKNTAIASIDTGGLLRITPLDGG
ncbi:MAG: serine/threonine-protein kinase, partial [Phycisphaerales bacterium]|nr:serine/threonine-protein kinase [Phycisphaerales bacterium]